jgi:uncharacterized protein YjbI with pentapeptide repeats
MSPAKRASSSVDVAVPRLDDALGAAPLDALCADRSEREWMELAISGETSHAMPTGLTIDRCRFTNVRLTAAALTRARLTDVVFEACELSAIDLGDAVLNRVAFSNCRMAAAQLTSARLRDVSFVSCKLTDLNARMLDGARLRWQESILTSADFYGAKIESARWYDCDLTDADMSQSRIVDVRLHGSELTGLRGAKHLADVVIGNDQVVPLALSLFDAFGISVNDERET